MSIPDSAVLRDVGPQDVDGAGELVRTTGVRHQGKALLRRAAKARPAAVTAAQSRPEDRFRTQFLNTEEVTAATEQAFGEVVTRVLYGRVRGKGAPLEKLVVVVLFETESGRTSRGVLRYDQLSESIDAYDSAVASGAFNPYVDDEDPKGLREELAKARAEVRRLAAGTGQPTPRVGREPAGDARSAVDQTTQGPLLTEASADELRERLAALEPDAEEETEEPAPPAGPTSPEGVRGFDAEAAADLNVDELEKTIPDLTEAQLDELEVAEKAGKDRKGVHDAIAAQRDARANA